MPYCPTCGSATSNGPGVCPQCGTALPETLAGAAGLPYVPMAPLEVRETQPLAGYGWRVLGFLLDSVFLAVAVNVPLRSLHANIEVTTLISVAATFIYGFFMISANHGRTIGMMMVRIRCVDATTFADVARPNAARRAGVNCALLLIGALHPIHAYSHPTTTQMHRFQVDVGVYLLLSIPHIIDLLRPLWNGRRQTFHDSVAHTVVVRPTFA